VVLWGEERERERRERRERERERILSGYRSCLEIAHKTSPLDWSSHPSLASLPPLQTLLKLQQAFLRVRSLLTHMGKVAGTEIEPQSQSTLLNLTMSLPGVVFAGVPGAGTKASSVNDGTFFFLRWI